MSLLHQRNDAKNHSLKPYGTIYSTYELPGTRIYRNDEVHHGLVLISDGKTTGRPARLELTGEGLIIQVPLVFGPYDDENDIEGHVRTITVRRNDETGLGFSIKGGTNGACKVPVLISKILRDQDHVERNKQLFVGDTILELNGLILDGKSHEEVVLMLKEAGDTVTLKVKHHKAMAYYLRRGSASKSSTSVMDKLSLSGTDSMLQAGFGQQQQQQSQHGSSDDAPKGWKTLAKIPLPMAYITRYLWGADKLRPNAFEVRAVDGSSSGLIYCEDPKVVDQWVHYITNSIVRLNNKSIKLSNKFLHPDELIVYLGWVCEKLKDNNEMVENKEFWQSWEPRFLILKGSEVCIFEAPPLNADDLNKCIVNYRIFETRFKDIRDVERCDQREFVFGIETALGNSHYMSMESKLLLTQLRAAWHRATYYAINRIQSRTFACSVGGKPSGLIFDIKQGVGLYDIHKKKYLWRYKFSHLKNSSDDGKMRIRLAFKNPNMNGGTHAVDLDCSELNPFIYSLHSFLLTRVMSVDPDFLEKTKL